MIIQTLLAVLLFSAIVLFIFRIITGRVHYFVIGNLIAVFLIAGILQLVVIITGSKFIDIIGSVGIGLLSAYALSLINKH